jgi:hypothetical protein
LLWLLSALSIFHRTTAYPITRFVNLAIVSVM